MNGIALEDGGIYPARGFSRALQEWS